MFFLLPLKLSLEVGFVGDVKVDASLRQVCRKPLQDQKLFLVQIGFGRRFDRPGIASRPRSPLLRGQARNGRRRGQL